MRLSKQERIGVLIIAVIIIILVGVFLFIVPRVETIGVSTTDLVTVQGELQAALNKADTKGTLKDQVISAYESGSDSANMFFEELDHYQADQEFNKFLKACKEAGITVAVDDLTVTPKTVSTLSASFVEEVEVSYDLKTYVTQGVEPSEEELAAQARRETLSNALAQSQNVGSISVTFTASALEIDTLIDFADALNSYYKNDADGESRVFLDQSKADSDFIRKAVYLNGIQVTYHEIEDKYKEMINEIDEEVEERARTELYRNTGYTPPPNENNNNNPNLNQGQEEEEAPIVEDVVYSLEATVTFFSIERMQDPSDQLAAQDNASA